ncbi:hypothetical protein [Devosia marina]|uniref:Uncharacterized protein n=1 Tax=Devosia marina TaxID=2683198 RepID=A0A7X3K4J8_9HYPH|nr:hypothetical protein [Devosia marina]MVT00014.1 hypothetical protein [Devosia marina]
MDFVTGPALWLVVLTVGVIVLGGAMAYGMRRNRDRTLSEKITTEVETRRGYEEQDKNPPD